MYKIADISNAISEPTRTVQYWVTLGILPTQNIDRKHGKPLIFSEDDLLIAKQVKILTRKCEVPVDKVLEVLRVYKTNEYIKHLVIDNNDFYKKVIKIDAIRKALADAV